MKIGAPFGVRFRPRAFSLVEIMTVIAIVSILLVIAIPGWIRSRSVSQARVCQQNLRLIDEAKEMLALSEGLDAGAIVTWDDLYNPTDRALSYLDRGIPVCPSGGTYALHPISSYPECSLGGEVLLDGSEALQHRIAALEAGGVGS